MRTKTLYSTDTQKCVTINRELLSDGYNYYICSLIWSEYNHFYYIDDNYKQPELLSYAAALREANRILGNLQTFTFLLHHNNGKVKLSVKAKDVDTARELICKAENCPPRALELYC